MVNPTVDASNKQIFARNKFRSNHERLLEFFDQKHKEEAWEDVFKPSKIGDFSSASALGAVHNYTVHRTDPDFALSYIIKNTGGKPPKGRSRNTEVA